MGQGEVIECRDKGFAEIPIGSKGTIDCPASMGYGDKEKPGIPENSEIYIDEFRKLIDMDAAKPDTVLK